MPENIAFLIHKRYIPDPEQLNQQRFKCAAQMREPLYICIVFLLQSNRSLTYESDSYR